jgi:hypothetical protein
VREAKNLEDVMMVWRKESAAILLILLTLMFGGCATEMRNTQDVVIDEYLLTNAGFRKLDVNDTTPKRQALMDVVPKRQFITYHQDGAKWYVYADDYSHAMYLGDEAAYQKYVSKTTDKNLCRSLDAENSAPFWSCFQEMQGGRNR